MHPDGTPVPDPDVIPGSGPDGDAQEEERRRQHDDGNTDTSGDITDTVDASLDTLDTAAEVVPSGDGGCGQWPSCDHAPGCGDCDCNLPCDCSLLIRLSTLLLAAAAIIPDVGGPLVRALIRGYRRRLTRFTPACPSTPSCSAYALHAAETRGPRRGLRAAAARIRRCSAATGSR